MMKNRMHSSILLAMISAAGIPQAPAAETLADRLLAGYAGIQTVSCNVRRESESSAAKGLTLSRVYFQKPDCIHVENIQPLPRTILADGTNFFSYIPGDPKGFSRPVSQLDADMLISLRKVPASAMDHLLRLKDLPEADLPEAPGVPIRKGYDTGKMYAVLSMDSSNRLAQIEFFTGADMKQRTAHAVYSQFTEAMPGVWLSRLHQTTMQLGSMEQKETSRFDNLIVNQPIAPSLFNASLFFKDVTFASSMDQIYPKNEPPPPSK
jgi:hypothetical protein